MSEFVTTSESRIVTAHGIFNNIGKAVILNEISFRERNEKI